jgi:hypothetical protein
MQPAKTLHSFILALAFSIVAVHPPSASGVELRPETVAAFGRYVQLTEARFNDEVEQPGKFLFFDRLPRERRDQVLATLERGEIIMECLQTLDPSGHPIEAPAALIHHWLGAAFVSGATLPGTLALMQDYDRHQDIYKPEVARSRLLSRDGNDFKIYYRLRKKNVITVTLNTYHDVQYVQVDSARWYSRSISTRIAEVENADTPQEREKPADNDDGFLWRLNSYWKFEEKDGGVYIECESISLTRDIPAGLGWLIKPFVTSIPKESLEMTMGSARSALMNQK